MIRFPVEQESVVNQPQHPGQYPQQPYQQFPPQQPLPPQKKATNPWVWLAAIAVVILALGAGCIAISSRTEPAAKTTGAAAVATTTAAAAAIGSVSSAAEFTGPDRAFLATLTNAAVKAGNSNVDLVNLGRKICPRISASGKEKAMSILTEAGFSIVQATDVMYAAVVAYCPDQLTGVR